MAIKQFAFNAEKSFIRKVDDFVKKNNNKYKDRTQLIILALEDKIKNESH